MKEVKEPRIETTRYYYEKERTLRFGIPELNLLERQNGTPTIKLFQTWDVTKIEQIDSQD